MVVSAGRRKSSLNLIRKMLHYIQPPLLCDMGGAEKGVPNFASLVVEVLANVLDSEVGSIRGTSHVGIGSLPWGGGAKKRELWLHVVSFAQQRRFFERNKFWATSGRINSAKWELWVDGFMGGVLDRIVARILYRVSASIGME